MGGKPLKVRIAGPLVPYASGFRDELERLGYRPNPASDQLRLMAHVSRWLAAEGLGVGDLTPARVSEFLVHRRAEGYVLWLSPKGMEPMLDHLRSTGVLDTPGPAVAESETDLLVRDCEEFLVRERGLAVGTINCYLHVTRLFCAARAVDGMLNLDRLTAGEVTEFVLTECRARSVGSAKYVVAGLRALMRYLYVTGRTLTALDAAVPTVAGWRLTTVPITFGAADVAAMLASCDRRTTFGRRDHAALVLLSRLGMRAGEVAGLQLADVDWRAGELVVRGKGRREERMPLPTDVGETLAGWLQRGRPACESTAVFTRVRAPHRQLTSSAVSSIVAAACLRAGLPVVYAHRLRHTAATGMLQAGATLTDVGQVLRHASALTTAIYAKVDWERLRELARPWPGGAS